MGRLGLFLARHSFLTAMALLLAAGLSCGLWIPVASLQAVTGWISPAYTTGVILFLMSATLDGRKLWHASAVSPGPSVLGIVSNMLVGPALAWGLSFTQPLRDFEIGLLIAGAVPCTLATAAVWTRKAGGNDAVALVVTLATNLSCMLTTTFWLELTTGRETPIDARAMGLKLLCSAVLPMTGGQLLRLVPGAPLWISRRQRAATRIAQSLVLLIVFIAASDAGRQISATGRWPAFWPLAWVWLSCAATHAGMMAFVFAGVRWFHVERADGIAAALAGSQKTLPIGLMLATDPRLFADPNLLGPGRPAPFVLLPMILFHLSQLTIDAVLIERWNAREAPPHSG